MNILARVYVHPRFMRFSYLFVPSILALGTLFLGACGNAAPPASSPASTHGTEQLVTVQVTPQMTTTELTKAVVSASKGTLPKGDCTLVLGHTSGTAGSVPLVELDSAGAKLRGTIVCDPTLLPTTHGIAMITAKRSALVGSHPAESGDEVPLGNFENVPPHDASDLRDTFMVLWVDPTAPEVFGAAQLLQWFHQVHQARRLDYMQLPL